MKSLRETDCGLHTQPLHINCRGVSFYKLHVFEKQAVWEAATICPRPLQVDLLTLKVVSESRVLPLCHF